VRLPRNVSPAAARRRALLADVVAGVLLGCLAVVLAAGIGVVGFFGLLVAIALAAWFLVEGGLRTLRRRRR
jgi:hypothetical protein